MAETIVFPDVLTVVVNGLKAGLVARSDTTTTVGTKVGPGKNVTARRTGGARKNIVTEMSQVEFECRADTAKNADALAQVCRGILFAMRNVTRDGTTIYTVNDAELSDTQDHLTAEPLSRFAIQIVTRGAAA